LLPADPFRDQPTLTGTSVTLKQLDAGYLEDYLLMIGDPEARRLTGSHTSEAHAADPALVRQRALAWLSSRPELPDRADWAILRNTDGRFVGEVVLNQFDQDNESVNFRIMLGPAEHFGHGYGSEATRLVIDYALNVVGVHRISLDVYAVNPRARHVYELCLLQEVRVPGGRRATGRAALGRRLDRRHHDVHSGRLAERRQCLQIGGGRADEEIHPRGDVRTTRFGDDLLGRRRRVVLRSPQRDARPIAQQGPVRAGAAVGHADTARVHDGAPVDQSNERHVRVSTRYGAYRFGYARENLLPARDRTVHEGHFRVVARGRVAAQHVAEPVDGDGRGAGECGDQVELIRAQLLCGPDADLVGRFDVGTLGEFEEFAFAVARDPDRPVAESGQQIQGLHRERAGGEIAEQHNGVRIGHIRFGEHGA
jgi:RimJ/RimL family protein N-acetyltransferase